MNYNPDLVDHFEVTDDGGVFAIMNNGEPLWWFGELTTEAEGCFVKRKNGKGKKGC